MLIEDIINLNDVRKQKNSKKIIDTLNDVHTDLIKHQQYEIQAMTELSDFEQWMNNLKQKNRLPGFETIDDITYYLVIDLGMPTWISQQIQNHENQIQIQKINKWFVDLLPEDKNKFIMIAHHAPRLLKVIVKIHDQLKKFQDKWWDLYHKKQFHTKVDAMSGSMYIDTQLNRDKQDLQHVLDITELLKLFV